jgi:hypothetical protein
MTAPSRSQPITASHFAADLAKLLAIMKGAQGRSDALMRVWDHDITAVERALARITELEELSQFLVDRLEEFDPGDDEPEREYHGHVAPAAARLRGALQPKAGS